MSLLRVLFLALPILAAATAAAAEAPKGMAVLTIAGQVGEANRGPLDPHEDGFLKFQERSFGKAFAFDREMLMGLPQHEIRVDAEGWPSAHTLKGPLVADVLKLAGAEGRTVVFYALDGFATRFEPKELEEHAWVLALDADGHPLGIGGRGPLWMAYDVPHGKASKDEEGRWAWAIFYAEVE